MQLLQGEAFRNLFRTSWRTAYHLELLDTYETPDESEFFRKFLKGEPDDFEWFKDWADLVYEVTNSGTRIKRARVVTEPHVDYTRWGLTVAPQNIAAGEEIRYLARHLIEPSELTTDDFWLFDNNLVAYTVFEPSGQFAGGAVTQDPLIAEHVRAVWNRVWDKATPFDQYVSA